jgi:hypothetical protein
MPDETRVRRNFLNRRDWSSFASALPGATTYPKLIEAVKAGRAWCSDGASQATSWLGAGADLLTGDVRGAAR